MTGEGAGGIPVLVAVRAKPNRDRNNKLNREFFGNFLNVSFFHNLTSLAS